MKILIIGASGLLARPVIRHLVTAGFQVRLFSRSVNRSMFDKDYDIVKGDVFNNNDLSTAMTGCDAVHITIFNVNEALAVEAITAMAVQKEIKLISYISGCTVCEENRWFPMIDNKFRAEQLIIKSGIPFMIFRPTWFFDSLDLMIRDGKAMVLGKQPHPSHWIAAEDFASMVATAYKKPEAKNKIFIIHGPEQYRLKELLEKYISHSFPNIKKVTNIPLGMLRLIAILTRNKELRGAASMFAYFEKVKEMGDPAETNSLLGKPATTFEKWLNSKS